MNIILTTIAKRGQGEELARKLVEEGMAACVSLIKIERSVFRWKGKVRKTGEYQLVIKSARPYRVVEAFILKHHSYEVPEILHFRITGGYRPYLGWMMETAAR